MAVSGHPRLTPEEAATLVKQHGESMLLSEREIASSLRDHVEEFGPAEVDIAGELYIVEIEGAEPHVPDLETWAERLADEIGRAPTDYQGHPDLPEEVALALVGALEPGDLDRLTDALLEAAPGFAERTTSRVLEELCEEIVRREDSRHSLAVIELIRQIEQDWRNQS